MWNPFKRRATTETIEGITYGESLLQALLSPDAVTRDKAMNIPAFAGCVNHICDTVAIIPIRLYKQKGESIEEVSDDRVKLLNDDTGDTLTGADFKKAMVYDYLTSKGGYAYIGKNGLRKWTALYYVSSDYVTFTEAPNHIHKDYRIQCDGAFYEGYEWLKFLRRTKNGYRGKSIIEENKELLAVAYNTLIFENALVKKGGNKKGFLQSEHKLSQESIDAVKKAYENLYSNNSENVVILNDGIKFQESSNTSVEMQLNENKKQNGTEICKIFNVPPAIIAGGATSQDWIAYIQYCILPILTTLCATLNRDLLLETEKKRFFFAPDVHELTKADLKTRYEAYSTGYKTGFLQIDDIRHAENMPALDMPFIKLGLQDVLYDPTTGGIYTPNTNKWGSIKDAEKSAASGTDQEEEPAPQGPAPAADETPDDGSPNAVQKGEDNANNSQK